MYSRTRSAVCFGMEGREVFVETDISRGLPGIGVVGLASTMVMESRERIKSAIENSGYEYPKGRITVNLTPASLRKNSSCLDLPIAIGILASEGNIRLRVAEDWGLRECAKLMCMDPQKAAQDPETGKMLVCEEGLPGELLTESAGFKGAEDIPDFGDIIGQENAKRAVVIAAAGRHGLLMVGSPGCGKTMIAGRMAGVMPAMTDRELLETAIVRSVAGRGPDSMRLRYMRPFRAPHHTIGRAGLVGGGSYPVPGEITLAHNGVLFLDEICEFNRDVIESLRIPLEEKKITHFRKGEAYTFPCNFQLVMAANPCPCGYLGDPDRECTCTQADLDRYRRKLSGPLMDRIDMKITMKKVGYDDLTGGRKGLTTKEMRSRVESALKFAAADGRDFFNAEIPDHDLEKYCRLGQKEGKFMNRAYDAFAMSPRACSRTLKVARTIADLDASHNIKTEHLAEALSYRMQE